MTTIKVKNQNTEQDPMWLSEAAKLTPWLRGKGADIGCGLRSTKEDSIRVDIDERVKPDVLASGDALPFKDGELDYITSIHSFEHFDDQYKLLTEWLRVLKPGGIIALVHPDVFYTKKQNPEIDREGLLKNPYNKHWHEHTLESFRKQLEEWSALPFRIIDSGPACPNWSFYFILKKV
jgi:predicted SAM-dependent methyltransferase